MHNEAARRVAQSITRLQLISPRMTNILASRSATRAGRKSRRRLDLSVLPNSGSQLPFRLTTRKKETAFYPCISFSFFFSFLSGSYFYFLQREEILEVTLLHWFSLDSKFFFRFMIRTGGILPSSGSRSLTLFICLL